MSTSSGANPALIVIFGITGDLSKKYLMPALYHLVKNNMLNPKTKIIGVSRKEISVASLFENLGLDKNQAKEHFDKEAFKQLQNITQMQQLDLADERDYANLKLLLDELEDSAGTCMDRLFYLSVPPAAYSGIIKNLGESKLNSGCQHASGASRILVEKPFGYDLESAGRLIQETSEYFKEEQIFRIDHYVAKETVQNILTFRFQNHIFDAEWNNQHISKIEVIAKEKIGIAGRAVFYEPLGALRDFIQSHLLQILGIILMEKPADLTSDLIHQNKTIALQKLQPVDADKVGSMTVRGQYDSYRDEVSNSDSSTETFAAIKIYSTDTKWQEVPFYLITGKGLEERKTEVKVTFKTENDEPENSLIFRIVPNEGIELDLATKKPGYGSELIKTAMDFSYADDLKSDGHPNAYERVLVDAIKGDHTLFATSDEVLASWRVVEPVIKSWQNNNPALQIYRLGSNGPDISDL